MENGRKQILLVEDDNDLAEVVIEGLNAQGYEVEQCRAYDNIFKCLQGKEADLIILDGYLDGFDGRDVLKQLNLVPITKNIPVIFASVMPEEALEGLHYNFYLQKAYGYWEMLAAVRQVIG